MGPYETPVTPQKCAQCRLEHPPEDFFRAGGRIQSQYWKSCNGCAEKAAMRRIKATERTPYLDPPRDTLPDTRGATFTDYRGLPPDPERDMRVATGLPVRLMAETFSVLSDAPVYGELPRWVQDIPALPPAIEQHEPTPSIDTLISFTKLPADLLRCTNIISYTPTSSNIFRAQFNIQQYALAIRLSKLCERWKKLDLHDWYTEASSICSISFGQHTYGANGISPWAPLASWLVTFNSEMSTAIEGNSTHDELAQRALFLVNQLHSTAELKKGQHHRGIVAALRDAGSQHSGEFMTKAIRKIGECVEKDCVKNGIWSGLSFTGNSAGS